VVFKWNIASTAVSSFLATNLLCRFRKHCSSRRVGNYSYTSAEPDLQALRFQLFRQLMFLSDWVSILAVQCSECDNNGGGTDLYKMRLVRSRHFRIKKIHGTEKLIVSYLVKRCSVFHGTESFITMITRDYHWTVSWVTCFRLTISLRSLLMLAYCHCLSLQSELYYQDIPIKFDVHFSYLLSVQRTPPRHIVYD
jgi:hypothetical protein